MSMSLKNPKRPKTDPKGNAVRHIPHTAHHSTPIDALLKYMYKYNFHILCTEFAIYVNDAKKPIRIKKKDFEGFSAILETMFQITNLIAQTGEKSGEELYRGIPIIENGFVNHFNPDDISDPYFRCSIYLDTTKKIKGSTKLAVNEVTYVGK